MAPPLQTVFSDFLDRSVLFAVELLDPLTQRIVFDGMSVVPAGIVGKPVRSYSGRFVWLREGDAWPGPIVVEPGRRPYERHVQAAPPRPLNLDTATGAERHVRIHLRPAAFYPIGDGPTAIRGVLRQANAPLAGVRVQLAWRDEVGNWTPPPPAGEPFAPGEPPSPLEQQTNASGEFLVFLHLRPPANVQPDIDAPDLLAVRLQFTVGRTSPATRVTDDTFEFLPEHDDPTGTRRGRVHEGRVLARELAVDWNTLTPI